MAMKMVCGFGKNDADYPVTRMVSGREVRCPAYRAWTDMLQRAYSAKYHEKQPTYFGVKVCEGWRSFMAFRAWWMSNSVDGYHLDKDLVGNGKLYSPETCIFVPGWLNGFINSREAARGEWPIGVSWHKKNCKCQAQCNHPFSGKEHLGYFDSPDEAYQAWKSRKLEITEELRPLMDDIDARIYHRVIEIILGAK